MQRSPASPAASPSPSSSSSVSPPAATAPLPAHDPATLTPEDTLVNLIPSQPVTPPPSDTTLAHDPHSPHHPHHHTIQFSDTTTPEDYAAAGDKPFVVLDPSSLNDPTDPTTHDTVPIQNGSHEPIIVMETGDGEQQWSPEDNHELKRVKVYELQGTRWVDQGTAFCFGHYDDSASEAMLIARAEADYNNVILQTTIRSSDVYQRQQETLIVWTEPNGVDYALSFQDPEGCSEVWSFIIEVQRMHVAAEQAESSSPFVGPDPSITTAQIIRSGHLPHPALGILPEIDRAIKTLSRTVSIKEKICEYILRSDYLKAMVDVMHQAEDLESLENLHPLCLLMQTILMLNDHSLYEHILDDDIFMGVLGMLEYDPEYPSHKANYRQFLQESTRFHQPIPVHDPAVEKKIHHTYRLQFLKDVALARALDDSTFNVLNSFIMYNQVDIIVHLQSDEHFFLGIARLFLRDAPAEHSTRMEVDQADNESNATPLSNGVPPMLGCVSAVWTESEDKSLTQQRREVILLIQQLCIMGKNVQLPTRMQLFKLLVDRGILHALHWAFTLPETTEEGQQVIAVAGEVLMTLLDHDVNGVREQVVRQCDYFATNKSTDESLLSFLCTMVVRCKDIAVQTLVSDALRMMLEMPLPDGQETIIPTKLFSRAKDDGKIEKFLDYFYKLCIQSLVKPILDIPVHSEAGDWVSSITRDKTNLYLSLCDLLSTFALQHSFRSHFFMLSSKVSSHVATLLFCRDKHLRLASLRYFRVHLKNANRNFLLHLVKLDVFKPILDLTLLEARRDTLIGSSCQEFFESIRQMNQKDIITHMMASHEPLVKELSETRFAGPIFKGLITRHEINTHPEMEEKPPPEPEVRHVDMSEENYFNADDDDDEEVNALDNVASYPIRYQMLRKREQSVRGGIGVRTRAPRPQTIHLPKTPPIGLLVDYGEDEEDADGEVDTSLTEESAVLGSPPSSRPSSRLSKRGRDDEDDDEDDALDRLAGLKPARPAAPFRPEKRRRENGVGAPGNNSKNSNDAGGGEVGFVKSLIARATKPLLSSSTVGEQGQVSSDGPRRIKLKIGAAGTAAAKATPPESRSQPGAKDGDTG